MNGQTNLYQAHRQWATRSPDERFSNLDELYKFTKSIKDASQEQVKSLDHLALDVTPEDSLIMNGNSPPAHLSNWAFGQLCVNVGAPAKYLRALPSNMAKDCLQYGLIRSEFDSKVLLREFHSKDNQDSRRIASAFTSPKYGRIWDADVVESLMKAIYGTSWHVPESDAAKEDSQSSGLYASDHDVFAFLINDENPVEVGNARLGRGFFCWNSETGAATFGLTTFLYNYICRNHIVWGAENIDELKIIHRNHAPDRFYYHALPTLNRFVENKSLNEDIKSTVNKAAEFKIGNNPDDVSDWFKNKPFTRKEIKKAIEIGTNEGEDVATLWGMIQGLTAYARDMPYIDRKVNLEKRAGALLTGL